MTLCSAWRQPDAAPGHNALRELAVKALTPRIRLILVVAASYQINPDQAYAGTDTSCFLQDRGARGRHSGCESRRGPAKAGATAISMCLVALSARTPTTCTRSAANSTPI